MGMEREEGRRREMKRREEKMSEDHVLYFASDTAYDLQSTMLLHYL